MNFLSLLLLALLPVYNVCMTFNIDNPKSTAITMFGPRFNYTFMTNMLVSATTPGDWFLSSDEELQPFEYTSALTHEPCYYCVKSVNGYFQIDDATDNGCTCKDYNCNEEFIRIYGYSTDTILDPIIDEGDGWRDLGPSYYTIKYRARDFAYLRLSRRLFTSKSVVKIGVRTVVGYGNSSRVILVDCGYTSQLPETERFMLDYDSCEPFPDPICTYPYKE